jgi:uncharacterized damage-inducible protein DinB
MSVASMYEGWQKVQSHLVRRLPELTDEDLALQGAHGSWPIWATLSHLAGARVYWLCGVFKEPAGELTPYYRDDGMGWEDEPDHPRGVNEVLPALESSWRIVQAVLERWTPEMLSESFPRPWGEQVQHHTRHSVVTRLVMHDSYHCGEVSLILGEHRRDTLDPWMPLA